MAKGSDVKAAVAGAVPGAAAETEEKGTDYAGLTGAAAKLQQKLARAAKREAKNSGAHAAALAKAAEVLRAVMGTLAGMN